MKHMKQTQRWLATLFSLGLCTAALGSEMSSPVLNMGLIYENAYSSEPTVSTESIVTTVRERDLYTATLGVAFPLQPGVTVGVNLHYGPAETGRKEVWVSAKTTVNHSFFGEIGVRSNRIVGSAGVVLNRPINDNVTIYAKLPVMSHSKTGFHVMGAWEMGMSLSFDSPKPVAVPVHVQADVTPSMTEIPVVAPPVEAASPTPNEVPVVPSPSLVIAAPVAPVASLNPVVHRHPRPKKTVRRTPSKLAVPVVKTQLPAVAKPVQTPVDVPAPKATPPSILRPAGWLVLVVAVIAVGGGAV